MMSLTCTDELEPVRWLQMLEIAPRAERKGEMFSSSDIKKFFFVFARAHTMTNFGRFDPMTKVLRDDTVEYVSKLTTHGRVI